MGVCSKARGREQQPDPKQASLYPQQISGVWALLYDGYQISFWDDGNMMEKRQWCWLHGMWKCHINATELLTTMTNFM